jgi:hypothetical protein
MIPQQLNKIFKLVVFLVVMFILQFGIVLYLGYEVEKNKLSSTSIYSIEQMHANCE